MGNSNSQFSSFYLACSSGDIIKVQEMITRIKLKELNRLEPNGSTALHVAATNGYFDIVELLLKHGCSTTTINENGKTAAEECKDERIRHLLESSRTTDDNYEQLHDETPKSKLVYIYENVNDEYKPNLATKIMKLRLTTYLTNQFKLNGASRIDHIINVIRKDASRYNFDYETIALYLKEAEANRASERLLTLWTSAQANTLFCNYIRNSNATEAFFMEILTSLASLEYRAFCGRAYFLNVLNSDELDVYFWACRHRTSLIETRIATPSSKTLDILLQVCKARPKLQNIYTALFIMDIEKPCPTALSIMDLSECPDEKEILIIPGTFFEVVSIEETPTRYDCFDIEITLRNIPVSRSVLLKTINELK